MDNSKLDFNNIVFDDMINQDMSLPKNELTPILPIDDNNINDNQIVEGRKATYDLSNINNGNNVKYVVPLIVLEKSCNANDVMTILVNQINGLQQDIKDLEEMRELIRETLSIGDPKSWRSTFAVENKLKTFTGFYSTILSYKKELNDVLFKLRTILTDSNNIGDQVKDAIKEALMKREEVNINIEANKKRLNELLKDAPGLMPTAL